MSTLVKELLKNYYNIDDGSKFDLNSAIEVLASRGDLNADELIILQLTMEQAPPAEVAKAVYVGKSALNRRLTVVARKISDYLGREYQDEKIMEAVEVKLGRKLTAEESTFCWKVIRSGRPIKGVNIFNFRIEDNGKITKRCECEDKAEGQVDM